MKINNIKLMNKQIKAIFVLAFTLVMSVTSCLNEVSDPNGGGNALPGNVESLDSQVAAMKISVGDLESVSGALVGVAETLDVDALKAELESCSASVQDHIASVEGGAQALASTVKAIELQGRIAETVGALKAQVELLEANGQTRVLLERIQTLEEGVASWLGDKFENYYLVSSELERVNEFSSVAKEQALSVDALQSDVEAGLRKDDQSGDLAKVASSVSESAKLLAEQQSSLSALSSELETGYVSAIKSSTSESKSTLKALNTKAAAALAEVDNSFDGLKARISACKATLTDLQNRLTKIEADVDELLRMIQSVSFMSDYSSDYAVAYYEMKSETVENQDKSYHGKCKRQPEQTIELNYMIRPAAAAAAVSDPNTVLKVIGYYADKIQTSAIDPSNYLNFTVNSVYVTNSERGIVSVTVNHDLNDDFFFKEIGAKCALSIATGSSDVVSKFVELVPKDKSATVYVEEMRINHDDFEIAEGQTKTLTVTLNPETATNKTVSWTSSNTEVATVDKGVVTAVAPGDATITATTNGINEWGHQLIASLKVKVNPAVRLGGPLYVEVGKPAELSLDFPPAMNIESKIWSSSDETKATVANGIVTGVAHTYNQYTYQYNPITITCVVNGVITLTHEMYVVVPQPRQIRLNSYGDDVKSVSMKLDQTISLAGSILPDNVDASLFRMTYESDAGVGWIDFSSGEIKAPGSVGGRYVYIKVRDKDKNTYMKTFVERTVVVNVEPYYVETMKFAQETITLAPDQTTVLSPVFTSDVDGKQPSYTSLNWVSSNPSVVSVNSTTGEISTLKEGSAVITATTTDANAVPSGQSAKSASCTVVVETPVAPINIGDYFYSDGTWSSQRDYSKTVIGIVFSNAGVATSDPILMRDCPKATHGLVVGLTEYNSTLGQFGYSSVYTWLTDAGYPAISVDVPNGYGLTKGMTAYRDANSGYVELYDRTNGPVAKHNVALPSGVSSWYIPSFKEMKWLHENKAVVNAALSNAGGTQITGSLYWLSTLRTYSYNQCQGSPFDMINGGWYAYDKKTTSYPVRVVFAF